MTQRMGLMPFLLMFVGVFAACPSFNQTGLPNAPNQNAQLPRQAAMPSNVAPIFDANPGHPWDQVREIFYARRFATGETFYDPHAFAPPWTEFRAFVSDVAFHPERGVFFGTMQLPRGLILSLIKRSRYHLAWMINRFDAICCTR